MKALSPIALLFSAILEAHAGVCMVQQADPESAMNYQKSVEVSIDRSEQSVELILTLPSVVREHESYELHAVALAVEGENKDQYRLFVLVAISASSDEKSKVYLILPTRIFERAEVIVNYGRCGLEYHLDLQKYT